MHVVVLGAGAIGGYFGGKMALAGYPVTFLVRKGRYDQLRRTNLRIQSVDGDFSVEPRLALSAKDIDKPDVVLVALKNYHLEGALRELDELVRRGAKLLPLLNGVRHIDLLLELYGKKTILGGLCYIEATLNPEGDVVHSSSFQDIVFGPIGPIDSAWLHDLASVMQSSGIHVQVSPAILSDMWKKYLFLLTLSSLTAGTRQPIGISLKDPHGHTLLKNLLKEAYQVAVARSVPLPPETIDQTTQRFFQASPLMTSSLHRDLEKGAPLELESLQGALIEMADEQKIDVPHTRTVYALLHPYAYGTPRL